MSSQAKADQSAANINASPGRACQVLAEVLTTHIEAQSDLCRSLERLADALPDTLRRGEAEAVIATLGLVLERAHRYEEQILHPFLRRSPQGTTQDLDATLARLCREHVEDRAFAEELSDSIDAYMTTADTADANRIGYMLRGFFEGLRRHIAFEKEYVLPILLKQLEAV